VSADRLALRGDERGTAAIEFAIVGPLLLLLVFGLLGAGIVIQECMTVRYALEQSARALQLDPSMTEAALSALLNDKAKGSVPSGISVTLTIDPPVSGQALAHATASYDLSLEVPFVPAFQIPYSTSLTIPLLAL
jgi:Flp pilus assembly protein TadG